MLTGSGSSRSSTSVSSEPHVIHIYEHQSRQQKRRLKRQKAKIKLQKKNYQVNFQKSELKCKDILKYLYVKRNPIPTDVKWGERRRWHVWYKPELCHLCDGSFYHPSNTLYHGKIKGYKEFKICIYLLTISKPFY